MTPKRTDAPCREDGCAGRRYGNQSRCWRHLLARKKARKEERDARKLARKLGSKKHLEKTRKALHAKCWTLMSVVVRRTGCDAGGYGLCFTCGVRKHWKDLQAGHRHHRRLDFDFRNVHPQCPRCNMKESRGGLNGNLGEYEHRLIEMHGIEWAKKLTFDANTHPGYAHSELLVIHADLAARAAAFTT